MWHSHLSYMMCHRRVSSIQALLSRGFTENSLPCMVDGRMIELSLQSPPLSSGKFKHMVDLPMLRLS